MELEGKWAVIELIGEDFWPAFAAGRSGPDRKSYTVTGIMRGENSHGFWIKPARVYDEAMKDVTPPSLAKGHVGAHFIRWDRPIMIAVYEEEPPIEPQTGALKGPIGIRPR